MEAIKKDKPITAQEIKQRIRRSGYFIWQVAEAAGISEPSISRWFRHLTEERTARILKALDDLSKQQGAAS